MKKLIFFLSVCCILFSCYDYHHYIPKDKLPLLKNNDIIYFKDSASSKIDTFRLGVSNIWSQTSEGEFFQYINIYYNKSNRKVPFLHFWVSSASVEGVIFGIENYSWSATIDTRIKTIKFTVQDVTYPNVYVWHDNAVLSDTIPNKVYLSCPNGIIRYEFKDGRVYELMNK